MRIYDFIRYRSLELLLDDADPGASLAEYLTHQPCVRIENLSVELNEGVATIRGRCGSAEQRERAVFILGSVVGIHRVIDAMEEPEGDAERDEPSV
jgi:osmotically-inducible protein OsmY